ATSAMNVSQNEIKDINQKITEIEDLKIAVGDEFSFKTYDENKGKMVAHYIEVEEGDTIGDILKKINDDKDNNVRAFIDEQSGKVIMEATRTGQYNEDGPEIEFDNDPFFIEILGMKEEVKAQDAEFTYNNGLTLTSKDNSYTLNGITYSFHDTGTSTLTVDNDTEAAFDSIMAFVDKYNEVVDIMNSSQREEKHRDFPPLTEAQKKEMTEKEIELWEEKAKSGLLRGDSTITNGLFSMRNSWYSKVETGGEITSLTQIGIETSSAYLDGGKLIVDEDKLRAALREDPDGVQKLFSNNEEKDSRGLVNRLEDSIE